MIPSYIREMSFQERNNLANPIQVKVTGLHPHAYPIFVKEFSSFLSEYSSVAPPVWKSIYMDVVTLVGDLPKRFIETPGDILAHYIRHRVIKAGGDGNCVVSRGDHEWVFFKKPTDLVVVAESAWPSPAAKEEREEGESE